MKRRDLIRLLQKAVYRLDRVCDHSIFEKTGARPVQVPNHKEINENTARAILDAAGISVGGKK